MLRLYLNHYKIWQRVILRLNKLRPRCKVCGAFLYHYESVIMQLCGEHRPRLDPMTRLKWRKECRDKLGQPDITQDLIDRLGGKDESTTSEKEK